MRSPAADESASYERELEARRQEYLDWIVREFGRLEPEMRPLDGRLWSLNHARLVTGTGLDEASRYFSGVALTRDPDFMGIRLLKTLLDFGGSPRLSDEAGAVSGIVMAPRGAAEAGGRDGAPGGPADRLPIRPLHPTRLPSRFWMLPEAREHLTGIITDWPMNEFSRVARWPRQHTENHDIMYLTIGLFSEQLRGQDIEQHLNEVRQSLAWRFERGFYEWNSHRYQLHYSNALQVLAAHAPAEDVRRGAEALFNVLLAERSLLSVGGYLGGPFMRGYDPEHGCDYLDDNRYDSFLPTMWLAFGVGEPRFDYAKAAGLAPAGEGYGNGQDPRLNQDEGMFFATGELAPHPIVRALLAESAARPELVYMGKRATAGYPAIRKPPSDWRTNQLVCYYNTPHISMGSVQHIAGAYPITSKAPSRYWSILFPAEPSQVLRTDLNEDQPQLVAQHRNWLVAAREVRASHRLGARAVGPWNLYRVGKGLCAHVEVAGWHVFQVSDLDKYRDEQAFVEALFVPIEDGHQMRGVTIDGDQVAVDLRTMAIEVNGEARPALTDMLHDSRPIRSRYGSGVIEITTDAGSLTIDSGEILRAPEQTPG